MRLRWKELLLRAVADPFKASDFVEILVCLSECCVPRVLKWDPIELQNYLHTTLKWLAVSLSLHFEFRMKAVLMHNVSEKRRGAKEMFSFERIKYLSVLGECFVDFVVVVFSSFLFSWGRVTREL